MSQDYQIEQAEKAAKAKQAADKAYYDQRAVDTSVAYNAWIEEVEQKRKAWKAKHPGEPYYSLPWSAAPGAKRVEIGGKSYYCAPTETGGIHCE
ncbi:MAG: hypothetical protein PUI29_04140 [Aeromonadales bacterium]|nr:hypothetical protein [Aeromonadales bacterium]MDY2890253.1 hypothetical protein [Succinivibrio sp.]